MSKDWRHCVAWVCDSTYIVINIPGIVLEVLVATANVVYVLNARLSFDYTKGVTLWTTKQGVS